MEICLKTAQSRRHFFMFFLATSLSFCQFSALAQQSKIASERLRLMNDKRVGSVIINAELATASQIKLAVPIKAVEISGLIKQLLNADASVSFKPLLSQADRSGITAQKFQQFYKNIKVQHGVYTALLNGENAEALTGSYISLNNIDIHPSINAETALDFAKSFVGAKKYAWEQAKEARDRETDPLRKQLLNAEYERLLPAADLVIVRDYNLSGVYDISYRFDIYAADPLTRGYVYVNAHSGKIMLYDKILKHVNPDQKNNTPFSGIVPEVAKLLARAPSVNVAPAAPQASVSTSLPTRYAGNRFVGTKQVSGNDPSGNGMLLMSSTNDLTYIPGAPTYVLIDDLHHSQGEETYDLNGVGGLPISAPVYSTARSFTDQNNIWTPAEHNRGGVGNEGENDDYAFDAHWGATVVYDYWNQVHNRKSYDNANTSIKSYVHYGVAYDNAFWNGSVMTYGDGSFQKGQMAGFAPLTSLDVCGHEIGHGVCSFTADLVYQGESGAMNEGYSDIWAACIENWALLNVDATLAANATTRPNGFKIWSIGEQIDANDATGTVPPLVDIPSSNAASTALRYMDDPNKAGDPASYAEKDPGTGRRWSNPNCTAPSLANDQCGVHTNSGVLNHLMYILTAGKSGNVNTLQAENTTGAIDGTPFNVAGIGFSKSEKIMYLAELMLTPNATFLEARNAGILAAEVLYGKCSFEWRQTILAWNAVAVGSSADTAICGSLPPFSAAIDNNVSEASAKSATDCNAPVTNMDLSVNILSPGLSNAVTVTVTPSGTATLNRDYTISGTSVNYAANASGVQRFTLGIYNDGEQEPDETIVLAIHATDGGSFTKDTTVTVTIKDDDFAPVISINRTNLLTENFESVTNGSLPAGWSSFDKLGTSSIAWRAATNSSYGFTGKSAFVSLNAAAQIGLYQPAYDAGAGGNVILRTPAINGATYSDLRLNFSYAAGGEPDGNVPVAPLDYGRILYSFDNVNYQPIINERVYGLTYTKTADSMSLPSFLANKTFYLGFEWYNDANVAVPPGFIIDDVIVSGGRQKIETKAGEGVAEKQFANTDIYYKSAQDAQIIARIVNGSTDLGCVTATLTQEGNGPNAATISFGTSAYQRANRVVQITPAAQTAASYTITLYATVAELNGMVPSTLKILKIKDGIPLSGTIAAGDAEVLTPIFTDNSAQGYYSFTATASGFSQFLLATQSALVAQSLLDFNAVPQGNKFIKVSWTATNEVSGTYEIERAVKGSNDYRSLDSRPMSGTGGTNSYSFNDYSAEAKIVYQYRLRIIEGSSVRFSAIRTASLNGKDSFVEIAPNPSEGLFTVSAYGYKGLGNITVYNEAGQEIMQKKQQLEGNARFNLDLTKYAPGVYTLKLVNDQTSESYKLIIQ